jgi:hypothetical protein
LGFRLGLETEFIMPFNKNKLTIIIEPTYQYFKSEGESIKANYKSIELPIGIRYYFFLNNNYKIFINASFVSDFSSNNSIIDVFSNKLEIKTRNNLAFGIGCKQNKKFSLEFRYQVSRELLSNYLYWSSDYNTLSVILGYTIF